MFGDFLRFVDHIKIVLLSPVLERKIEAKFDDVRKLRVRLKAMGDRGRCLLPRKPAIRTFSCLFVLQVCGMDGNQYTFFAAFTIIRNRDSAF